MIQQEPDLKTEEKGSNWFTAILGRDAMGEEDSEEIEWAQRREK